MLIHASIEKAASERRGTDRRIVRLQTVATSHKTAAESQVEVHDLSAIGFLMRAGMPLPVGEKIGLQIADSVTNAEVVWVSGGLIGCRFTSRLSKSQLSAALLKSEPTGGFRSNLEPSLSSETQRLAEVIHDIDAKVRELVRLGEKAVVASQALVDAVADAPQTEGEQEDKLPLYVRGWTILLSSILLWTLLLWGTGFL